MVRKFFPQDKNYLLEEAQLRVKDRLLTTLIDKAIFTYQRMNNPLGLNDAFSEKIAHYYPVDLGSLYTFYETLAGIYRFKYGENQLGFLWDGRDHCATLQTQGQLIPLPQSVFTLMPLSPSSLGIPPN